MQGTIGRMSMANLTGAIAGKVPRRIGSKESRAVLLKTRCTEAETIHWVQCHVFNGMGKGVEGGRRGLLVDLSVRSYASNVRTRPISFGKIPDAAGLREECRRNVCWLVGVAEGEQTKEFGAKVALQCRGSTSRPKRDESAIVSDQCSHEEDH